jgi:hypothetical protein
MLIKVELDKGQRHALATAARPCRDQYLRDLYQGHFFHATTRILAASDSCLGPAMRIAASKLRFQDFRAPYSHKRQTLKPCLAAMERQG